MNQPPMKLLPPLVIAALLTACQKPAALTYQIVSSRPHDAECYTQGLEFSDGRLFESGGNYGR